ncbi:hypothetical protein D3C80_1697580 [compost metagenome]
MYRSSLTVDGKCGFAAFRRAVNFIDQLILLLWIQTDLQLRFPLPGNKRAKPDHAAKLDVCLLMTRDSLLNRRSRYFQIGSSRQKSFPFYGMIC